MLTEQQFNKIDFGGRRGLSHLENVAMFEVYQEYYQKSGGCNVCEGDIKKVIDEMYVLIDLYKAFNK
jgi:hypothetical protein